MALLGLAMGVLVFGHMRNVQRDSTADGRSVLAMAQAREALIGYAATYRDLHPNEVFGYLPCPDRGTGVEGQAQSACGGADVTVIGRLPWKTLDLPPLRDASGECLWYAVSGNFKYNPKTADLMNRDSNGLIEVMAADGTGFVAGASPQHRAIAVVFSPGAILPGQDRALATANPPTVCGGGKHYSSGPDTNKYDPANYLDIDIASDIDNAAASTPANALSRFIAAEHADRTPAADDAFNDLLMPIFPDDIFARHLDKRADMESALTDPLTGMLRKVADCLVAYGRSNDDNSVGANYKFLPWAANLDISPFGTTSNYIDADGMLSGRLPRIVSFSANDGAHKNIIGPPVNYTNVALLDETACLGWDSVDEFWNNWKDHVFYAVSNAYKTPGHQGHNNDPCSDECIKVEDPDGTKTDIAAVVIFAGARQAEQTRDNNANPSYDSTEKADPANYLEGDNLTSIQLNPADSDPDRLFSKIDGNDTVMCLVTLPVGSETELFVDPTCGTSARCVSDGTLLAAYRSGLTNDCRVGSSSIDATCQTIANRIDINNCPGVGATYSCERAARDFLSYDCLLGFASTECQLAHTTLTACS
jgi:hypothetical protein